MWWQCRKNGWHRESTITIYPDRGSSRQNTVWRVIEIKFNKLHVHTQAENSMKLTVSQPAPSGRVFRLASHWGPHAQDPPELRQCFTGAASGHYPLFHVDMHTRTYTHQQANYPISTCLSSGFHTPGCGLINNRLPSTYYLHRFDSETLCTVQSPNEISLSYVSMSAKSSSHTKIQLDLSWNLSSATGSSDERDCLLNFHLPALQASLLSGRGVLLAL